MELNGKELVSTAAEIARHAHLGQVDKLGVAYIEHPRRVSERFDAELQPLEAAAAWLHDVIEDTDVSATDLLDVGIPAEVVTAVELLSKNPDEPTLDDYYARIRLNPIALAVKTADIADNTDPARTAALEPETRERLATKYAKARALLGIS